jgi:glycosyltransferase involved in cell wall biosynthesis
MIKENTPAISILTLAYNVEQYIEECAESVLNQSFKNFEWIVLDNGCSDRTGEILREYAKKDNRIKLFKNEKNSYIYNEPHVASYYEYISNLRSEYWCWLDSDDYIHKDFLEVLYTAGKKHNADIIVGGTEMFNDENPEVRGIRCPPDFFTDNLKQVGDILPQIYGSFRPMWGKLFKVSIINEVQKFRIENPITMLNGEDTVTCFVALSFSNSVVAINKVLHYYRIRKTSLYYSQVDKNRYLDYIVIYQEGEKLLHQWNKLSPVNLSFIANVLYYSIRDCMDIAAEASSVDINDRFEVVETIISDEFVHKIFTENGLLNNYFMDIQRIVKSILKDASENDVFVATTHYIYKLYKSIEMGNTNEINKQNAFLMYLAAACDEDNKTTFGANLLYSFLSIIGKHNVATFEKKGISSKTLVSNRILLRAIINSDFENAIQICESKIENDSYEILKQELIKVRGQANPEWIKGAKALMEAYFSKEEFDNGIDWLLKVLDYSPLDKEALCYKLYLLSVNGDLMTALETAEVLRVFYPDDSTVLMLVGQAYTNVQLKNKALKVFQKALDYCADDTQRKGILNELEAIEINVKDVK